MSDALPPPPVPEDCDLRDFEYMMFPHKALFNGLWWGAADDRDKGVMLELVGVSMNQVPTGSLPSDIRWLMNKAGVGSSASAGHPGDVRAMFREAVLSAFVLCSDGRFYHPDVAPFIARAWRDRLKHREDKANEAARKRAARKAKADKAKSALMEGAEIFQLGMQAAQKTRVRRMSGGHPGHVRPHREEISTDKSPSEKIAKPAPAAPAPKPKALKGGGAQADAWWTRASDLLRRESLRAWERHWRHCTPFPAVKATLVAQTGDAARFLKISADLTRSIVGHDIEILTPAQAEKRRNATHEIEMSARDDAPTKGTRT